MRHGTSRRCPASVTASLHRSISSRPSRTPRSPRRPGPRRLWRGRLAGSRAWLAAAGVLVMAGLLFVFLSQARDAARRAAGQFHARGHPVRRRGCERQAGIPRGQPGRCRHRPAVDGRSDSSPSRGGHATVRPGISRCQSRGADAAGRLRPRGHPAPHRRTRSRAARAAARRDGANRLEQPRSRSPHPISSASKRRFRKRVASAFQAHGPPGRGRTEDPQAFQAYLQGRAHLAQLTAEETLAATAAFERALALDSQVSAGACGARQSQRANVHPLCC